MIVFSFVIEEYCDADTSVALFMYVESYLSCNEVTFTSVKVKEEVFIPPLTHTSHTLPLTFVRQRDKRGLSGPSRAALFRRCLIIDICYIDTHTQTQIHTHTHTHTHTHYSTGQLNDHPMTSSLLSGTEE